MTCEITGCTNPARARGKCRNHYNQWHRIQSHRDTSDGPNPLPDDYYDQPVGGRGAARPTRRTSTHRCGYCTWQGSGRDDCPNNRGAA